MSDLLKRLQQAADDWQDLSNLEESELYAEASSKITRLRTLLERARPIVTDCLKDAPTTPFDDIETLLAEIDEVLK